MEGTAEEGGDRIVTFAEIFKTARKAAGLSLARLSDKCGVSDGTINGWERGTIPRSTLPVLKAARSMGADTDMLFEALTNDYERRYPER